MWKVQAIDPSLDDKYFDSEEHADDFYDRGENSDLYYAPEEIETEGSKMTKKYEPLGDIWPVFTTLDEKPKRRPYKRPTKDQPHETDIYVGEKIRDARVGRGLTQTIIAEACGITFQQIQKYENGKNRVSASRLGQIAQLTGKPIQWFFPPKFSQAGGKSRDGGK